MQLLILGGTRFLGRHIVDAGLARGHEITLFNRGISNPDLYPMTERLRGDRDGDLVALDGKQWDAIIDTCGYIPRVVNASVEKLKNASMHYTFISTISVYADFSKAGLDEDSALGTLPDDTTEELNEETYGPLKSLCERKVVAGFSDRALIVRPGLIVGPHDPTDRFTYWPWRVAKGDDVLAPDIPGNYTQFIDGRDLAEWIIHAIEEDVTGVFNATGPSTPLTMGKLLKTCKTVSESDAMIVWVDGAFLLDQGVTPWKELPLWLPGDENYGADQVNISRAIESGLVFRPLEETIEDTLTWVNSRQLDHEWRAGLDPEREKALLQKWRLS